MNILIYTTTTSAWYQEEADKVAAIFDKVIPGFTITLVSFKPPTDMPTIIDSDGDRRPSWDYLQQKFPVGDYDGVGVHFTTYYRSKWNITPRGSKNTINKEYPEFWMCADNKEKAVGYPDEISNFMRILIHELCHFFEDLDDQFGDKLNQNSVHLFDYDLKRIHAYPYLIDYRGWLIKRKVWHTINSVINFIRKSV